MQMNNKQHELKPCPFCGCAAKLEPNSKTVVKGNVERNTYVRCPNCDARGGRFLFIDFLTKHDAREAAINAWNRRVINE